MSEPAPLVRADRRDQPGVGITQDQLIPAMWQTPNFRHFYSAHDRATGRGVGISLWETREQAEGCTAGMRPRAVALCGGFRTLAFRSRTRTRTGIVRTMSSAYLCTALTGEAAPGHEPEPEFAAAFSSVDVRWVSLVDEAAWGSEVLDNPITERNLRFAATRPGLPSVSFAWVNSAGRLCCLAE